jgi:heme/copper-type cytochrome/quinol oxidase subunit 1
VLSASAYNQMFTMHGTTMVFLFVMPMAAAFANYLIPLQIGARDVAFPRLNAFGFWSFLVGGLFLNSAWLLGVTSVVDPLRARAGVKGRSAIAIVAYFRSVKKEMIWSI